MAVSLLVQTRESPPGAVREEGRCPETSPGAPAARGQLLGWGSTDECPSGGQGLLQGCAPERPL